MIKFVITLVTAFLAVGAVYNYVPLKYFEIGSEPRLGSSITTILGTDRLTDSRAVINANFTNLNTDKLESGSLTPLLTIASSTIGFLRAGYITATSTTASTFAGAITSSGILTGTSIVSTGSATSTFVGGGSFAGLATTKGINIAAGYGAIDSLSTATSSFSNGISVTGGCISWNNSCLGPLNLAATNIWTGNQSFSYTSTSTWSAGIESPSIASAYFVATSTTATSTLTSLRVSGAATTTDLTVSGTCVGCSKPTQVSSTGAGPTGSGEEITVSANCTGDKLLSGGGAKDTAGTTAVYLVASFPADENTWSAIYRCTAGSCAANTITTYAICVNP